MGRMCMILRVARRDAWVRSSSGEEKGGEVRKEGRANGERCTVLAGEEGRRWEGAPELCGVRGAESEERDGRPDGCLFADAAKGSGAGGSPQAQPGERGQKRACGSMLVLLLGAELTSSFPPSQDPEPDSRQDFIFA